MLTCSAVMRRRGQSYGFDRGRWEKKNPNYRMRESKLSVRATLHTDASRGNRPIRGQ
jgi:hypothetical protein